MLFARFNQRLNHLNVFLPSGPDYDAAGASGKFN